METLSDGLKAARLFRNYYHACANKGMTFEQMSDKLNQMLADPDDWWKFSEDYE